MIDEQQALNWLAESRQRYAAAARLQMQVWQGKPVKRQPLLLSSDPGPEHQPVWPAWHTEQTHFDAARMYQEGLRSLLSASAGGMDAVPSMRANMGCGIFATLFPGIHQELFPDKMPWVLQHLDKQTLSGMEADDLLIGREFSAGISHMQLMARRLAGSGCRVFPMDLQGPFDLAHLVYGDTLFYDLFDDPPFVHHLLELACQAIFKGMDACLQVLPDADESLAHYNNLVMPRSLGGIKTSEDTSTLLSHDHIHTFVLPYLDRILQHFGGGYVHYCGKNPHLLAAVLSHPQVCGINFGNPDMHDMPAVLRQCAQAGKIYYGAIPPDPGLELIRHFSRLLAASENQGRHLLLLACHCPAGQQSIYRQAWQEACSGYEDLNQGE